MFLGEGTQEVRDAVRGLGVAAYSSEDGDRVMCPNCEAWHDAPIPELFDVERHPFGRLLAEHGEDGTIEKK